MSGQHDAQYDCLKTCLLSIGAEVIEERYNPTLGALIDQAIDVIETQQGRLEQQSARIAELEQRVRELTDALRVIRSRCSDELAGEKG